MTPPPAAPAPRRTPWYRRWWAITVGAVAALCLIGTIGQALTGETPSDSADATDQAEPAAEETGSDDEDEAAEEAPFTAEDHQGSGDAVVTLPEGADTGMVTASYSGSGHFSVSVIDADKQPTGDLLVNTTDSYEGTSAFGLSGLTDGGVELQITAGGDWEITIAPLTDAPMLELPAEGSGDAVYRYEGGAANWMITHEGQHHFSVQYYTDAAFSMPLLVNEIGSYAGTSPVTAGPAVVTVTGDGDWTISVD